jgi:hypothetical protein
MKTRTLVIVAAAVAGLATAGTATARPVPVKHPVAPKVAHRQLCICVTVAISPEVVAAATAREEWNYDQQLIDEGFAPVYGTTGHYGYDVPAG